MSRNHLWIVALAALAVLFVLAGCGGATPAPATSAPQGAAPASGQSAAAKNCTTPDKVALQLKWVAQAQFAGYYASAEKGYYKDECLDVTIKPGGPDIVPEQVVAGGQAQFGIDWLPSLLSAREQGTPLVNIAQVFQYSGMREISWKDTSINSPSDLKGKKVAVWFGGNEFELLATLNKYNIDKDKDVTLVQQPFDMNLLLQRQVGAAAAMTYNEYAQVLESKNPTTNNLYQPGDLNIIDFNKEGTAMLEDGIFTTESWIKDAKNQDIATRFLRASFKGWIYCRDNMDDCVNFTVKAGSTLGKGHQAWMMNEINKLIWPSPNGIGIMDDKQFQQTADIALKFGVIKKAADKSAYTTQFAQAAQKGLESMDPKGTSWQAKTLQVTEGGK